MTFCDGIRTDGRICYNNEDTITLYIIYIFLVICETGWSCESDAKNKREEGRERGGGYINSKYNKDF